MKCSIKRLREGYEILVVYEPLEFDDPERINFGTDRVLCNPSSNEAVNPIIPGIAYGWLLAPGSRKVPLILDDIKPVPASMLHVGFERHPTMSADVFTVDSLDDLSQILESRYNGTANARLITDANNENYIGIFYDRVVRKLMNQQYTDVKKVKPASALMLVSTDVRTGFDIVKKSKPELISKASMKTVDDIILRTDCPANIYIDAETLNNVHSFISNEVDSFGPRRKNLIFLAIQCFCPNVVKYDRLEGQNADGLY